MAPAVASAKLTLSYPLYASDFDPQNASFLLVGGGGGEGRTGVSNKITLINTSRKQTVSEVVDIDLSKDEDSVTSLAVASSTESSVTAFAGINSSEKDQNVGQNEHLRSFRLEYPPKRRTDGETGEEKVAQVYKGQTAPLGRASLFMPSVATRKETYQRITRLSRPCKINGAQLGAIATGLAPEGEIVLFDAKTNGPMGPWVEARLSLGQGVEAADVDIIGLNDHDGQDVPPGTFSIAYCTDYDVQICKMTLKQTTKPQSLLAHSEPHPDTFATTKARPKFRSLRFLTPNLLLLLQNRPNRQGAELLLIELSPNSQGKILSRKRLHKGINSATALSITYLASAVPSKSAQHVVAVAGQDTSVSIFSLEHPTKPPFKGLKFRLYTLLRSVHPLQITSLSFSTFSPPQSPQNAPPQYVKLASTSIANTVVVNTLPLIPYLPPSQKSPRQRYVLTSPGRSETAQFTFSLLISAFAIALGAFFLQAFVEIRGGSPEYLGAKGWLSQRVHDYIAIPYVLENQTSAVSTVISSFGDQATLSASSLKNEATNTASIVKEALTNNTPQKAQEAVSSALDAASSAAAELKQASDAYSSTASSATPSSSSASTHHHIRNLLSRHHHHRREESAQGIPHMIIQHHEEGGQLKASFHHVGTEGAAGGAKKFEDLSKGEKEVWKKRLRDAGAWAVDEGEAVLKGVFFGGVAGAVGEAVGRAMG
ncbi:MAG: hypothetical protein Q9220_004595 [cf. Caloplaca sp. 1 TL-2023]